MSYLIFITIGRRIGPNIDPNKTPKKPTIFM